MKRTHTYRAKGHTYRTVEVLDPDAMTVADYAREKGCTNSYIYHLITRKKADFEIVIFKGINFVIPLTKNSQ